MTTLKSNRATQAAMNEFAIQELTKELQAANDLIEIYKVALEDEGNAHLSTKRIVRNELNSALLSMAQGHDVNARAILNRLIFALQ